MQSVVRLMLTRLTSTAAALLVLMSVAANAHSADGNTAGEFLEGFGAQAIKLLAETQPGEARRESYSNRFATALDGVDPDRPGETLSRTGKPDLVPRFVGPVRRKGPVEVRDVEFLRSNTDRTIKITVPGPFTMGQQAVDDYYHDERALAMALANVVGSLIGTRLALRHGAGFVRQVFIFVVLALIVKTGADAYLS